jgi:hypothetical protein
LRHHDVILYDLRHVLFLEKYQGQYVCL